MEPAALGGIGCVFIIALAIVVGIFAAGQILFGSVAIFVLGFLLIGGFKNL